MREPATDLYGVLGVGQSATAEQIKKRFRELARRYHPDVARTPNAAERFKEISEAYHVLSDPGARAAYDAEVQLKRMRDDARKQQEQRASSTQHHAETPRPSATSRRQPPPSPRPSVSHQADPRSMSAQEKRAELDRLIAQAQTAFEQMQYRAADELCRRALRVSRRHPVPYEILGDIHRMRGRVDEAVAMYSYAVQMDPRNRELRAKLERVAGRADASYDSSRHHHHGSPEQQSTRSLITAMGMALIAFLVIVVARNSQPPAPELMIFQWDPLLPFALLASGLVAGFLMSLNGQVGFAREELALQSSGRRKRFIVPVGAVLLGFAVVWYYASLLLYLLIAAQQEAISKSVMRSYGAAFAVGAVFAIARVLDGAGAAYIMAVGPNLAFVAIVLGWAVGDSMRGRT